MVSQFGETVGGSVVELYFHKVHIFSTPTPEGALTWKGGKGMSGGQDPLFTPLPPFFRSPVAAWFSSLDPYFEQKYKFFDSYEKNLSKIWKNFQFCSLNLAQISVHKPSKFEKFSVPQPLLLQSVL